MRYLTDNEHLYEFVSDRLVRNAGLAGGTIRTVIAVDCVTGEPVTLKGDHLGRCHDVIPLRDAGMVEGMLNARHYA